MKPHYFFISLLSALYITSHFLYNKVLQTSREVIDELFHVPQGIAYCNENYTYWDPKITTLPGLYLVSSAIITPFFECNIENLRYMNVVGACLNFYLFYLLFRFIYMRNDAKIIVQGLNLALLPPLYFFSFLYYTETLSMTSLLIFIYLCLNKGRWYFVVLSALLTVLMRQTNIMWVAMVLGHKLVVIFIKSAKYTRKNSVFRMKDVINSVQYHINTKFIDFFKTLLKVEFPQTLALVFTLLGFLAFVIYNGSVVLGDKSAHNATLHLPQIFYFTLFYGVFGLPHILNKLFSTCKLIANNHSTYLFLTVVAILIIQLNTIIHPYMLADNRHYTFYIWNRWYGKYLLAKDFMAPVYIALLFSLYDNLRRHNSVAFFMPFCVCLLLSLGLQKMIEVRYFIVPYITLRLRFEKTNWYIILGEFSLYVIINAATLYVFFTKEVRWSNFEEIQRIIW